ncbi:MAG: transcription-repair coupling factor, partial [Marinosulfonomonas sp.]|nr:transcription-repair coupling factor [Marinosulfonomonas sp.]
MAKADHITLGGAPEGFDAHLLAQELARSGQPVVHIARDDKRLAAMRAALQFYAPGAVVLNFPSWDCLPFDRTSPNADVSAARMATLAGLAHGMPTPFILLTTLSAATQRIPARTVLKQSAFRARVGERIDEAALRSFLTRMGFVQTPTVTEPGDYAVRGGIIDIYPPLSAGGQGGPVRLDLFGDILDGARHFDPATQRTTQKLTEIELAPVSEIIMDEAAITRFRQNYRVEFGAAGSDDPLYEAISAGRKHQGAEHWLPFFHEALETLFDYLPDASIMLDGQITAARLARWDAIEDQYDTRHAAMSAKNRMDTVYKPCPPELLYLNDADWGAAIAGHRVVQLNPLPQSTGLGVMDAGGRIGRNFAPERQQQDLNLFKELADHIDAVKVSGPVVVASYSEGARERLGGLLEDEGQIGLRQINDMRDIADGVHLVVWALEHGFTGNGVTVISEQDVLGDRLIRSTRRKRRAENFLTETQSLSVGDLIVHVDHGVGIYKGLETITAMGAAHECIALEYAGGDRLFLPVENIELLSKFGHEQGLLDK